MIENKYFNYTCRTLLSFVSCLVILTLLFPVLYYLFILQRSHVTSIILQWVMAAVIGYRNGWKLVKDCKSQDMDLRTLFHAFLFGLLICSIICLLIYANGFLWDLTSSIFHSKFAVIYMENIWLGKPAFGTYMNYFIFFTISFLINRKFMRKPC